MTGEDDEVSESFLLALEGRGWMTVDVFERSWSFMDRKLDRAGSCVGPSSTLSFLSAGFLKCIWMTQLF
jgi:hypothetical protein